MNKKNLLNRLDNVANAVAKRGIYVVDIQGQYFRVVESLRKQPVLCYIPTKRDAEDICHRLNRASNKKIRANMPSFIRAQKHVDKLADLHNEMRVYQHTINKSDDSVRKEIAESRIFETRIKIRSEKRNILKQF